MNDFKNLFRSFFMLVIICIILCLLHGCTTTKYVPMVKIHTDTLYKDRKDSVRYITMRNIVDSLRWRDSVAVKVDANGNVIGTDSWHWREHINNMSDSTSYYKLLFDSIREAKVDSIPKPYSVYRDKIIYKLHWWQTPFYYLGMVAALIIGIYIINLLVKKGILHL